MVYYFLIRKLQVRYVLNSLLDVGTILLQLIYS
jgi:hypothetical protein